MRYFSILMISSVLAMACSSSRDNDNPKTKAQFDRLASQFKDITEIADIRPLTEFKNDMLPFFSPSGDRVYFTRLTVDGAENFDNVLNRSIQNYLSIDYRTNKLFALQAIPEMTAQNVVDPDSLPSMLLEKTLYGIRTDSVIYFNTENTSSDSKWNIYKYAGDSLIQITYGAEPSLLNVISPDGRYLAFTYGNDNLRLVIMNIQTNQFYAVPKNQIEASRSDFAPQFSPDSRRLVFLRSGDLYRKDLLPVGNIWLVELKN